MELETVTMSSTICLYLHIHLKYIYNHQVKVNLSYYDASNYKSKPYLVKDIKFILHNVI